MKTQFNNETGVALCNGVYASESDSRNSNTVSCNNTKQKATLAKEVLGIFQLISKGFSLLHEMMESITKESMTGRSVELQSVHLPY